MRYIRIYVYTSTETCPRRPHRSPLAFAFFVFGARRRRPGECYPDNPRLAKALETLASCHEEASFLVPVGAVRAVDSLRALSKGGKALVIAGDKG